jgi:Calcineurin-like phosphoesterase
MAHNFKSRHLARHSNIPWLGRTRLVAHLQSALAQTGRSGKFPPLSLFLQSPIPWIKSYLRNLFHGRYKPYPGYALDGRDGIYRLESATSDAAIRLSIVADWGTGTQEAYSVAQQMTSFRPDYTVHLGDVYYIGDEPEVQENFFGIQVGDHTPVAFPRGAVGTLTLPGNHELYGSGRPYYTQVVPWGAAAPGQPQRAAFFSLESEHWRIIGLDTGYNSTGIPILGSLPGLASIPSIGGDAHLEPAILNWLRTNVRPREQPKTTLLLSHHQYFSAFPDEVYPRIAAQLREFFHGQNLLWLWGHEHRLAVYDLYSPDGNLRCYGRCIGHGGMPVEVAPPEGNKAPLVFFDPRHDYPIGFGDTAGWNGFVNLTLEGARLTLDYRDLNGERMYREAFVAKPGGSIEQVASHNASG